MKPYRVFVGFGGMFGLGSAITTCGVFYAAFREENGPLVEEKGRVLIKCNDLSYKELKQKIQENSILRITGRKDDKTFHVEELLEISAPPEQDEKEFLESQLVPVTFTDAQFGEFSLNRELDWFEGHIPFRGEKIPVTCDNREDIETLRRICADTEGFLEKAAAYAAAELLDLANDWCHDAWADEAEDGEEYTPLTQDDFMKRMTLQSISLWKNGQYSLWYDDGDMFWGHSICVEGNAVTGFTRASMQG